MDNSALFVLVIICAGLVQNSAADCYQVPYQTTGKIGAYHNVCNPEIVQQNVKWETLNVTGGDIWLLLPPISVSTLLSLDISVQPNETSNTAAYLYDQLGTPYNIFGEINYPAFSEWQADRNTYLINARCVNISQPPFFARSLAYKNSNNSAPIKNASLLLRTGTSDSFISDFETSKTIPPNSFAYFSWELNASSSPDSYTTVRFTEILSSKNISASIYSTTCALFGTCVYTPLYPNYRLSSSSKKNDDGKFLTIGFPSTKLLSNDDLVILGINNDLTDTDLIVSVKTYQVITTTVNLGSSQKGIDVAPRMYSGFQIPYNPFPGVKIPPLITIKIIVTPEGSCDGDPYLSLLSCKNDNLAGCNVIDATFRSIQSRGCDPMEILITSEGPWEYFSIYNQKNSPMKVTITISGGGNQNSSPFWVWLLIGISAFVGSAFIVLALAFLCRRQKSGYQNIK